MAWIDYDIDWFKKNRMHNKVNALCGFPLYNVFLVFWSDLLHMLYLGIFKRTAG